MQRTSIARIAVLILIGCWALSSSGQEAAEDYGKGSPAKDAHEQANRPVHAYRIDFAVNELEDGKKINSRQYSMNLNADDANEIKIGTRVPVDSGPQTFQYLDVGTNIWCRIGDHPDGVPLTVRADISSFAMPDQAAAGRDPRPIVRQVKINASTLAQPGKPVVVGSVDDPNSRRQFQLEVTVTKVR